MKVKVSFTVEIDADAWVANYGTEPKPAKIRDDVKIYCEGAVIDQLEAVGVLLEGE